MSFRRLQAVARKEFLHVRRDPRALGVSLVLPLALMVLYSYALRLDVDHVPLAVWDQSNTPQSRDLVSRFVASRYFTVVGRPQSYGEMERALDRGRILLALVIPADFAERAATARPTEVQLLADGSDPNTASLALNYADAILQSYGRGLFAKFSSRYVGRALQIPVRMEPRVWFNTDLESRNFIVPGLIAVNMMLIAAVLTSLTVVREWEAGTMEQVISTPLKGSELVLGKLVPYFVIGLFDMALSIAVGRFLFDVPLRGNLFLLSALAVLFLVGGLALGILISIVAKNQVMATQMAFVSSFLPTFLLSGFMFDIGNMPRALQGITVFVPARHFVTALRSLFLKGVGLDVLAGECLLLALFAGGMLALAIRKFRKELG